MRANRRVLLGGLAVLSLTLVSGCAVPLKVPIFTEAGFHFDDLDVVTFLPPVDARVDKKINVNLDKQLREKAMNLLRKRGYDVATTEDVGGAGEIIEEDLREAKPEWIKELGPGDQRWMMVLCLVDVRTKLTFGSTGNAEVTAFLFDRESGRLVWRDKGAGRAGQGGLAGMMMKGSMDNAAINAAIFDVLRSIPKRP